jgi:hypothetical protein
MTWRRGELWLDNDVLWFGERSAVPAVAGYGRSPLPSFGPPPGLAASRLRRAAWKRRRAARRAKATAVALSPAVVFMLAALRSGGDPGASLAADDPPSLTFRLPVATEAPATGSVDPRAGIGGAGITQRTLPPVTAEVEQRAAAPAEAPPLVEWHRATSLGLPWGGSLVDGTQLPLGGPDWVTWNPVADSVPNEPRRLYGTERTIRAIVSVTAAYRAANPDAPKVVIGDISREGGGPMTDEHVSHQNGLDVDVYFPRRDGALRAPIAPDEVDRRLTQDLLDRFVAAGAQVIFVGYSTGLHGPAGVVVAYRGHEYHMHVRFPPPRG